MSTATATSRHFGTEDYVAIPVDCLGSKMTLPCAISACQGDTFVPLLKSGEAVSPAAVSKLPTSTLYAPAKDWPTFLVEYEKAAMAAGTNPTEVRNYALLLERTLEHHKKIDKPLMEKFRQVASRLATALAGDPNLRTGLLRFYEDSSLYYSNHSVNVALYSAGVGIAKGFKTEATAELILAALLHNIGNLFLAPGALYRAGALTSIEKELVRSHPTSGAIFLEKLGASEAVVRTAREHHEKPDGTGYPAGLKLDKIHPYALICHVADGFDALTNYRPHQSPKPIDTATAELGKTFTPEERAVLQSIVGD